MPEVYKGRRSHTPPTHTYEAPPHRQWPGDQTQPGLGAGTTRVNRGSGGGSMRTMLRSAGTMTGGGLTTTTAALLDDGAQTAPLTTSEAARPPARRRVK
jgi:hypothetical protein